MAQGGRPPGSAGALDRLRLLRSCPLSPGLETCRAQVFGSCFTLGGFPPWLLQYAELYHLGSLGKLKEQQLRSQLQRYSATKQRFGT